MMRRVGWASVRPTLGPQPPPDCVVQYGETRAVPCQCRAYRAGPGRGAKWCAYAYLALTRWTDRPGLDQGMRNKGVGEEGGGEAPLRTKSLSRGAE